MGPTSILVIYGTRPEAIKLAPVIRELRRRPERCSVAVCSTGQHREMVAQAEELFGLLPDIRLELMSERQPLNLFAARALRALDGVLAHQRSDWVVVQGDTSTALVGALAAFHRGQAVAHVEAGLRSGDLAQPFPEEANRRITDLVAALLFAPTRRAAAALEREGCLPERVHVTGNTIVDALLVVAAELERDQGAPPARPVDVLVTLHRRESQGRVLEGMLHALCRAAARHPELTWHFPVHHSPEVREPVHHILGGSANVRLEPPFDYRHLLGWLRRARLVLTDSGGIQEEAPSFGVPVLVLRETTERPEGIEAGVARLAGTEPGRIERLVEEELARPFRRTPGVHPYGDGHAAERIVSVLLGEPAAPYGEPPRTRQNNV